MRRFLVLAALLTALLVTGNAQSTTGAPPCELTAQLTMTTATTTQIVALAAGQAVRVCGFVLQGSGSATATTVKFVHGTGTACATGIADLTPAWNMPASAVAMPNGVIAPSGVVLFKTAVGSALCATSSAAGTVRMLVIYAQY